MPSPGSYSLKTENEIKTVERDQSYKSCILALLIFFLLCMTLIIASWALKKSKSMNDYHDGSNEEFAKIGKTKEMEIQVNENENSTMELEEIDSSTGSSLLPVKSVKAFERYVVNGSKKMAKLTTSREENSELSTSQEENLKVSKINSGTTKFYGLPVSDEKMSTEDSTTKFDGILTNSDGAFELEIDSTSSNFRDVGKNVDTTNEETTAAILSSTSDSTMKNQLFIINSELSTLSDTEKAREIDLNETQSSTTEFLGLTDQKQMSNDDETSSTMVQRSTNKMADAEEFTKKQSTEKEFIENQTSLLDLLIGKYFGNETTARIDESSNANWLDKMADGTTRNGRQSTTRTETAQIFESTAEPILTTDFDYSNRTTIDNSIVDQKIRSRNVKDNTTSHDDHVEKSPDVCMTGSCKQMASKIISYMNHSADPCDDFYEYACGGLESDYQINEKDFSLRIYETIQSQAKKHKNHSDYNKFNNYHESCVNYEMNFDIKHRIDLARLTLEKIGKFYTTANWPLEFQGLTKLFANMLLLDRPLLFDIVPDINETNPEVFTLKIGPTVDSKIFQFSNDPHQCENNDEDLEQTHVDLDRLYQKYKNCKNDTRRFVTSIKQALTKFGVFDSLKNNYNRSQYIDRTVINIDLEIIRKILWNYPSETEIVEAYRSKRYTIISLGALQDDCKLLNWTELIHTLTGLTLNRNALLQIYHKDRLIDGMRHLNDFGRRQPIDLNNALLGLWSRNLYQDLVETRSSTNLIKHCFYIATHYMEPEASALYMSSFAQNDVRNIKTTMGNIFRELKETLRGEIIESQWTDEWGRQVLLKKLNDIKISFPELFIVEKKISHELNITDNYFVNSINLMKKYRTTMYNVINKNPKHLEQIWTFFASPLDFTPRTIYSLNLIAMPFGAIDSTIFSQIYRTFDYLTQATIGNLVAREIAHNFDINGIRYWNGSRDSEFALLTNDDATKTIYEDYINCHKNDLYQESMEMSLPMTGQRVSFTIPPLSLNERLSDAVGMRLANDTLARLGIFDNTKRLPWLDLDVSQLFYLAYAQTLCTKSSLTSSYVSLHENPLLPSRIRLFVVASNDKRLGEAWKCPEGSKITPTFVCDAFPHLEIHTDDSDAV